jgi:hypothetical protein
MLSILLFLLLLLGKRPVTYRREDHDERRHRKGRPSEYATTWFHGDGLCASQSKCTTEARRLVKLSHSPSAWSHSASPGRTGTPNLSLHGCDVAKPTLPSHGKAQAPYVAPVSAGVDPSEMETNATSPQQSTPSAEFPVPWLGPSSPISHNPQPASRCRPRP